MLPSCLSINSSLPCDRGDGLVDGDLPQIVFENSPNEEEEEQLQLISYKQLVEA